MPKRRKRAGPKWLQRKGVVLTSGNGPGPQQRKNAKNGANNGFKGAMAPFWPRERPRLGSRSPHRKGGVG